MQAQRTTTRTPQTMRIFHVCWRKTSRRAACCWFVNGGDPRSLRAARYGGPPTTRAATKTNCNADQRMAQVWATSLRGALLLSQTPRNAFAAKNPPTNGMNQIPAVQTGEPLAWGSPIASALRWTRSSQTGVITARANKHHSRRFSPANLCGTEEMGRVISSRPWRVEIITKANNAHNTTARPDVRLRGCRPEPLRPTAQKVPIACMAFSGPERPASFPRLKPSVSSAETGSMLSDDFGSGAEEAVLTSRWARPSRRGDPGNPRTCPRGASRAGGPGVHPSPRTCCSSRTPPPGRR